MLKTYVELIPLFVLDVLFLKLDVSAHVQPQPICTISNSTHSICRSSFFKVEYSSLPSVPKPSRESMFGIEDCMCFRWGNTWVAGFSTIASPILEAVVWSLLMLEIWVDGGRRESVKIVEGYEGYGVDEAREGSFIYELGTAAWKFGAIPRRALASSCSQSSSRLTCWLSLWVRLSFFLNHELQQRQYRRSRCTGGFLVLIIYCCQYLFLNRQHVNFDHHSDENYLWWGQQGCCGELQLLLIVLIFTSNSTTTTNDGNIVAGLFEH
jgi:hypothetical protein